MQTTPPSYDYGPAVKTQSAYVCLAHPRTVGYSHVAVWAGVSTPDASTSLQAGIESSGHGRTAVYVEERVERVQTKIEFLSTSSEGQCARVSTQWDGAEWDVAVNGKVVGSIKLPQRSSVFAITETMGDASGDMQILP